MLHWCTVLGMIFFHWDICAQENCGKVLYFKNLFQKEVVLEGSFWQEDDLLWMTRGQENRWTGIAKVIKSYGNGQTLARIVSEAGAANSGGDRFSIMAGDHACLKKQTIIPNIQLLPLWERSYEDLFMDPWEMSENYELSLQGWQTLEKDVAPLFGGKYVRYLVIESLNDGRGSKDRQQRETESRSLSIKQALVSMGFSEDRIVALGHQGEPKSRRYVRIQAL